MEQPIEPLDNRPGIHGDLHGRASKSVAKCPHCEKYRWLVEGFYYVTNEAGSVNVNDIQHLGLIWCECDSLVLTSEAGERSLYPRIALGPR